MEKSNKPGGKLVTNGRIAPEAKDNSSAPTGGSQNPVEARLNADQQSMIGQHLQALYDEIVKQELPQKLKDLLATLDKIPPK